MIMTISGNQIEGIIVEGIASNDQIFCESFIETSLLVVCMIIKTNVVMVRENIND